VFVKDARIIGRWQEAGIGQQGALATRAGMHQQIGKPEGGYLNYKASNQPELTRTCNRGHALLPWHNSSLHLVFGKCIQVMFYATAFLGPEAFYKYKHL
jgi:hypothetical protein